MNQQIKSKYNTLSNCYRKFNCKDLLYVIWAYEKMLPNGRKGQQLPHDVEYIPKNYKTQKWLHAWILEQVATEAILHGKKIGGVKNPRQYKNFQYIYSRQQEFFYQGTELLHCDKMNDDHLFIMKYMNRLGSMEFEWQNDYTTNSFMYRYYSIYSYPEMNTFIIKKFGFSYWQFYIFMFVTWGQYTEKFEFKDKFGFTSEELGITPEIRNYIHNLISTDLKTISREINKLHRIDETYGYGYNPLKNKPIICDEENTYICPLPELITWKSTKGFFYELCKFDNFHAPLGKANASYIEKVARKLIPDKVICCDEKYKVGKGKEKQTSDVIIEDKDGYLFIECKANRMRLDAKAELIASEAGDKEDEQLKLMCEAVIQIYKTVSDAKNGFYDNLSISKFKKDKKVYAFVTTMEDWYIFGNRYQRLKTKVIDKLNGLGLTNFVEDLNFLVISNHTFENFAQALQYHGLNTILSLYFSQSEGHGLDEFLHHNFPINYKFIFEKENDELFERILGKLKVACLKD